MGLKHAKHSVRLPLLIGTAALAIVTASSAASAADDQTMTILAASETRTALDAAAAAFEEANPGVTISIEYTDESTLTSTLPTRLAAGNAPDLFTTWPGTYSALSAGELGRRGFAADLTDEPWAQDIPANFADYVGADGKVYYAPLVSLSILVMYNQTKLDELGLEIPTTWDEVLAFCADAADLGVTAYSLGAQTDWQNQFVPFVLAPTLVDRTDPTFLADRAAGTSSFAESGWLDVFAKEREMNDAGCFRSPLGTSWDIANTQVASGQALGLFGPSSTFGGLQAIATESEIVAAPLPATNDPDETWLAVALGASLSVNADATDVDLAKSFVDFLMQPANANAYAAASGQAPAIPNDAYVPAPETGLQIEFGRAGKTGPVADQLFPTPRVRDAWIATNQAMLAGDAQPIDVVSAMDEAWDNS